MMLVAISVIWLSGCFWQNKTVTQPTPIVQKPSAAPTPVPTDALSGDVDTVTGTNNVDRAGEFDENGEFDPTKFSDEDVDEIMELMKELIGE